MGAVVQKNKNESGDLAVHYFILSGVETHFSGNFTLYSRNVPFFIIMECFIYSRI